MTLCALFGNDEPEVLDGLKRMLLGAQFDWPAGTCARLRCVPSGHTSRPSSADQVSEISRDGCGRHRAPKVCAAGPRSTPGYPATCSQLADPPERTVEPEWVS
jgi:hypothetical protein